MGIRGHGESVMWCLRSLVVLCGVVAWSSPVQGVVGGAPAALPEPDAAVVFVQRHGRNARIEGLKDNRKGYYTFAGIRYAEPPVGQRRFQRPVRRLLSGDITAKKRCQPCPQMDPRGSGRVIGQEDCLCINVFAPKMPGDEQGCPVLFFIHGGNYRTGSTAAYGGEHFTKHDTIIVTAQYRLGSLGYFSTGEKDASGNTGLFDLHTAMAWVNDYIEFFGGDRTRVVVMGQGSGGSAASLLALSPEGKSAAGVAALSGSPLSPGAVRSDPVKYAEELAELTGCPVEPAERLLMCLRKMSMAKIVEADKNMTGDMIDTQKFLEEISGRAGAGARVEGGDDKRALPPLVSSNPSESLNNKEPSCPLLTGVTSAETSRAVFGKYEKFLTTQLKAVQDFIKKDVIGGLRGVVQDVSGLVPLGAVRQLLPLPDYYQALFDSSLSAVDGLTQIAEATGDALFNFPAYQSVQAWSGAAPAYLYSFEHVGNLSKGSHFIPGIALTQSSDDKSEVKSKVKGPAHGDELAYLFEPLDDEGQPLGGQVSDTDARVRDSFIGLIAKFAHNTGPSSKNTTTGQQSNNLFFPNLVPFSKDGDQYLKISDKVTIDKNFRFCQMGLWGNMADRVTGAVCKNVLGNLLNLPKLIPDTVPVPLPEIPSAPILGGLLTTQKNQRTTKRPSFNSPFKIFDMQ